MVRSLQRIGACIAAAGLVVTSGCAGAGSLGASANEVTIALVSNSQMADAQKLSSEFEKANPGTKLKFISLSENQARAKITMSTAMGGRPFDVAMISNFEAAQWAETIKEKNGTDGICLRGKPGWGEVLAPLDTVINTFGGRWFDDNWNAQLNSPEVKKVVNFYVDLVNKAGELGASSTGFQECANLFGQGQTAMWYDATSAVSVLEDPKTYPDLVGKIGYLPAPIMEKPNSGWLYTWALGIPKGAKNPDGAWKFISWMTSKDYMRLVGEKLGWARVPPGSRTSTYTDLPEYQAISKSYGPLTLESIKNATPDKPTVQPVPYTGVQFVGIPEFQDLGTRVSQQISAAMAGQKSVDAALDQAQEYAEVVGKTYQEK